MRIMLIALLVIGAGCRKKAEPPEPAPEPVVEAPVRAPIQTEDEAVAEIVRNFQRVHFAFDSTDLVDDSDDALSTNAKILQEFPEIRVEIQGHADERGTTDYNLALGQRRANLLKDKLERMGVPSGRITLVSYGEERPLVDGSGDVAWSKNRRGEFRVLKGTPEATIHDTVE